MRRAAATQRATQRARRRGRSRSGCSGTRTGARRRSKSARARSGPRRRRPSARGGKRSPRPAASTRQLSRGLRTARTGQRHPLLPRAAASRTGTWRSGRRSGNGTFRPEARGRGALAQLREQAPPRRSRRLRGRGRLRGSPHCLTLAAGPGRRAAAPPLGAEGPLPPQLLLAAPLPPAGTTRGPRRRHAAPRPRRDQPSLPSASGRGETRRGVTRSEKGSWKKSEPRRPARRSRGGVQRSSSAAAAPAAALLAAPSGSSSGERGGVLGRRAVRPSCWATKPRPRQLSALAPPTTRERRLSRTPAPFVGNRFPACS